MKHISFQKLFFHHARRNTFIQYFLSYFILFSVLLLGSYIILRNQVSGFYFEKLENQASTGLNKVSEELENDLTSINHIQNAINSNAELILFHHDNTPWNQYQAFQELEKYALGNRFIDSIVYLDKHQQTVFSTSRHVEYHDGTFYIFDEAVSVPFFIEETDDSPYRLSYVSNGTSSYLIYYPGTESSGSYSVFFIINMQEIQQLMKNALSEEIVSMVLLASPDNKIVTGANIAALEPFFSVNGTLNTETGANISRNPDTDAARTIGITQKISLYIRSGLYGGFSMAALISNQTFLAQMNTAFRNTYLALLLLSVIGMGAVVLGMRHTFLPLHKLTKSIVKSPDFHQGYVDQLNQAFSDTLTENKSLRAKINQYRLAMQKSILSSIVKEGKFDEPDAYQIVDQFFNMEPDNHIVALQMKSRKSALPCGEIMRFFNDALPGTDSCVILEANGNSALFLLNYTGAEENKDEVLRVLMDDLFEKSGYFSAVSNGSASPLDIPFLYENAIQASNYWEQMPVVSYSQISGKLDADASHAYPYDKLESLASLLKKQDFRTAHARLQELFCLVDSASAKGNSLPDFFVRCVLIDVLTTIVNSMNQMNIKFKVYRELYFETLYLCRSCPYQEAEKQIKSNTEKFLELFENELANKSLTSAQIRQMIEAQYTSPDFSISSIADSFDVSVAYVSYLFKSETGENVSDYVWNLRLEKAKELLLTTDMSVDNISVSVGYVSTSSFRRKFKQDTGVTPSQFRSKTAI